MRLEEPRRFIQVVSGPRQVGKTTLVRQVLEELHLPSHTSTADDPAPQGKDWLVAQWNTGRILLKNERRAVLVIDEIQKIPGWSESVKRLWDEDSAMDRQLAVVLLGSAPLLIERGLSESLAGRFETIRMGHWSAYEMAEAFDWSVEQSIYFGGYPGAASLIHDEERWRQYVRDSLIETTIARDVLLLARIDKPAILRRLVDIGCRYSGQILSYTKMLGQLQDAGNTTTLAHYLSLLSAAGLLVGIDKFAGEVVRTRASSPKLQVLNTALLSALGTKSFAETRKNHEIWGRQVESAVGTHLANGALVGACELFYWRERNREVDFIVRYRGLLTAVEVKSGKAPSALPGLAEFTRAFRPDRTLIVGSGGIPVEEFLSKPLAHWFGP